jgi:DNA-binding NtrC family response regulator
MNRLPPAIPLEPTLDETQKPAQPIEAAESVHGGAEDEEPIASLRVVRAQVEIKAIMAALKRTGWNRKQAARLLKISYRGLLYKIRRHNITAA